MRDKENIIGKPDKPRRFSFIIELENIFGFVEDYDKVTYGMPHKLTLVRKSDTDAIFRNESAENGRVPFTKIAGLMPRVHASNAKKFELCKKIESNAFQRVNVMLLRY